MFAPPVVLRHPPLQIKLSRPPTSLCASFQQELFVYSVDFKEHCPLLAYDDLGSMYMSAANSANSAHQL